jgi:FkbM family methyltransferase
VEPNAEMVACLEVTFAKEIREGRVRILPYALGSLCGEALFSVNPGEAFSGRFDGAGAERVPIITLDQLVSRYGAPTMIKMDLEGSEYEALRGGLDFLSERHAKLAVTTYHHPWDYAVIAGFLKGVGYRHLKATTATLRGGIIPRPMMIHAWLP